MNTKRTTVTVTFTAAQADALAQVLGVIAHDPDWRELVADQHQWTALRNAGQRLHSAMLPDFTPKPTRTN